MYIRGVDKKSYDADHSDLGLVLNLLYSKNTEMLLILPGTNVVCTVQGGLVKKR